MIKRHIPNAITCCNLISGCTAIVFALYGQPTMALLFIVIGALFDFCDGFAARLLKVSSPIGKELDSLADVVTFGVAPSAMLYNHLLQMDLHAAYPAALASVLPFVAFVMAAFSALRLAKFNLDERQTTSFLGLPTPANALFWVSLLIWIKQQPAMPQYVEWMLLALMVVSCWLLVSEVPMFALKFKHKGWTGNELRYGFILLSAAVIIWAGPIYAWAVIISLYVIISVIQSLIGKHKS